MHTAEFYAELWAGRYLKQAESEGWVLAYHTADRCYELERLDDEPNFSSDDEVIKHVLNRISLGSMYYVAFYLDRRPADSRCWLPTETISDLIPLF
jgi:hypothetical protein